MAKQKLTSRIAEGIGRAIGVSRKPLDQRIEEHNMSRHEAALNEFNKLALRDPDSMSETDISRLADLCKTLGFSTADAIRQRDLSLRFRDDVEEAAAKNARMIAASEAQKRLAVAKADFKSAADRLWEAKKNLALAQTQLSRSNLAESRVRTARYDKVPWATSVDQPA